jgi:sterol desaturase/sphingolipid hydroxylase (fatty acid hydroxylase superfamily)
MNWNQSRLGYYADFIFVPLVMLAAVLLCYHGAPRALAWGIAAGALAWTFVEYWTHRVLFHHVFHDGHELHHKRPSGYVAAPFYLTAPVHLGLMAAFTRADDFGTGLFLGLEAGYCAYILVHDRFHHTKTRPDTARWFGRRWKLHAMHHHGIEANFGVITSLWDHVFRTNYDTEWVRVRVNRGGVDGRKG